MHDLMFIFLLLCWNVNSLRASTISVFLIFESLVLTYNVTKAMDGNPWAFIILGNVLMRNSCHQL